MTTRDRYPTAEKPARFDPARFQADDVKLFPPLRSEPEDVVGYIRTGGCTAGCGACCEAFVIPLDPGARSDDDFAYTMNGRLAVPVDPTVIGKADTDDWERWLTLHDTTLLALPSGVLVADPPVTVKGLVDPMIDDDEWFAWLETLGVAVLQREGQQVLAYITRKCSELGEDGRCRASEMPQRPQLCGGYPQHPSDIQGLEQFCTYNFALVERAELMARGLIGQGRPRPQPKKARGRRKKRGRQRR